MLFPLCAVDISSNEEFFNQTVFDHLTEDQAVAISGLPDELNQSIKQMFDAYDNFLGLDDEQKRPFCAEARKPPGLHLDGEIILGARGYRYYICSDEDGLIEQRLPTDGQNENTWRSNCNVINQHVRIIVKKVARAIDSGLIQMGQQPVSQYFKRINIASSWHRYHPVNPEENGQPTNEHITSKNTDEDGVISFAAHQDFCGISVLFYRNNETRGLQGQHGAEKHYCDMELPEGDDLHAIVVTGLLMEHLTANRIEGLWHRVASRDPEKYQSRVVLVNFINIENTTLIPAESPEKGESSTKITAEEFFQRLFAEKTKYLEDTYGDLSPGKL